MTYQELQLAACAIFAISVLAVVGLNFLRAYQHARHLFPDAD